MNEEGKHRELPNPDIFGPPFFGVGLGEKLGSLDARLVHLEKDVAELKSDVKSISSKVDEIAQTVVRHDGRFTSHDERFAGLEKRQDEIIRLLNSHTKMLYALFITMLAAIIVQKFL